MIVYRWSSNARKSKRTGNREANTLNPRNISGKLLEWLCQDKQKIFCQLNLMMITLCDRTLRHTMIQLSFAPCLSWARGSSQRYIIDFSPRLFWFAFRHIDETILVPGMVASLQNVDGRNVVQLIPIKTSFSNLSISILQKWQRDIE
jgi:hypothetical protein